MSRRGILQSLLCCFVSLLARAYGLVNADGLANPSLPGGGMVAKANDQIIVNRPRFMSPDAREQFSTKGKV